MQTEISRLERRETEFITKTIFMSDLESKLYNSESELAKLKHESTISKQEHDHDLKEFELQIGEFQRVLEKNVKEISDLRDKLAQQLEKNEILINRIKMLEEDSNELKGVICDQKNDIDKLIETIKQKDGLNSELHQKLNHLVDDIDILRNDNSFMAEQHIEIRRDYEQLQKAFEDLQIQNGESSDLLIQHQNENLKLRSDNNSKDNKIMKLENDIEDLQQVIFVLESKNKEFVETINQHFYNQASDYKEKVLGIFKLSEDPKRIRKALDIGIEPSYVRLKNMMQQENQSLNTSFKRDFHYEKVNYDTTPKVDYSKQRQYSQFENSSTKGD